MNRNQGDVSFNKDWQAYKVGFGNLSGDHWLGLEHMHLLTENRRYTLRYVIQYMHLCHGKQALHTVRPWIHAPSHGKQAVHTKGRPSIHAPSHGKQALHTKVRPWIHAPSHGKQAVHTNVRDSIHAPSHGKQAVHTKVRPSLHAPSHGKQAYTLRYALLKALLKLRTMCSLSTDGHEADPI